MNRIYGELKKINLGNNIYKIKQEAYLNIVGTILIPCDAKNKDNAGKTFQIRLILSDDYPFKSVIVYVNDVQLSVIDNIGYEKDLERREDVLQYTNKEFYKPDPQGWMDWTPIYTIETIFNIIKYMLSRNEIIELYNTLEKKKLINDLYEKLDNDLLGIITSINFPIHYLFDHTVIESVSSSSNQNRIYLRNTLKLDQLFLLDPNSITDITTERHSTILYKFEYNNRKYIYYSNSGLGINNQLRKYCNITSCNILYFHNKDELWNNLTINIKVIIESVNSIVEADTKSVKGNLSNTEKIWNDLLPIISNIINKSEYDIIIKFILKSKDHRGQNLCYALLNFICSKYNKNINSSSYIERCSINHLLYGDDNTKYTDKINQIIESNNLKLLINNCYGYNEIIYKQIAEIPEDNDTKGKFSEFKQFIDDINSELLKLKSKTIQYKLKHSFKLLYSNISGLYNNEQQSGSCTFYSYYNLALNMKILNIFNTSKDVQTIIKTFITFHNIMIYLFCLSNDTRYIPKNLGKFKKENLYNIQYINRLIRDEDLLDDIISFYPHPTFLLHPDKLLIDKLLNFKIAGTLKKKELLIQVNNEDIFKQWYDFLCDIIFNIRSYKPININQMYCNIKNIFTQIIQKINNTDNIYKLKLINLEYGQYNILDLYFNTISEIWIIYLIYLYEIYNKKKYNDLPKPILEDQNIASVNTLEFLIPEIFIEKDKWHRYDTMTFTKKSENIKDNPYGLWQTNRKMLLIYLNFNEIVNISKKINKPKFINIIKEKYKIDLNYCNFITVVDKKYYKYLSHDQHDITNLKIYSNIYENYVGRLSESMNRLLNLYIEIKHKIYNTHIDTIIQDKYRINIEILKKNIKENIKKNIYKINQQAFFYSNGFNMSLLILILTNNKLLLINEELSSEDILNYSLIRNFEGRIFYGNYKSKIKEILTCLCNNDHSIDDKIYDKTDDKIENILKIITNTIDKIEWIEKLGFTIPKDDIINKPFIYKDNQYISLNYDDENSNNDNNITLLLSRFGFDFRDINEYIFLYPNTSTSNNKYFNKVDLYDIKPNNEKCFILINKYKKCIEITFTDNPNNSINMNECYIFDETNKDNKNKLLFNLSQNTHPFISIIPENSPYLCYEKDNNFYLEFILSSTISKNLGGKHHIIYKKIVTDFNFDFSIYTIKIAPSYIFPTINTFNNDYHNKLFEFYDVEALTLISKNDSMKQRYKMEYNVSDLNIIIDDLYKKICATIACENTTDITQFNGILETIEHCKRIEIINSFYTEHRIANFHCNKLCIGSIIEIIPILTKIKSKLISEIKPEKERDDFVINNIHIWLLVMEVNILINLLNHFKIDMELKSGDIQDKLTILKSIKYFNDKIKNNFYYGIELLFLLQNEYFFKESQMKKYNKIREDLRLDDPSLPPETSLKLHQFMMGKGKTSVFTPLLSFVIILLKNKQPTIITLEHLINPTRKYTIFIENIMKIKVNIFSDFQAKKRWLEHTDKQLFININEEAKDIRESLNLLKDPEIIKLLKQRLDEIEHTNLNNEMNLIDEFDSHHNYLQSMFNCIKNNIAISEDLFIYIFNFTFNKINGIKIDKYEIKSTANELIKNADLLDNNLNIFFKQSNTMIYNKEYGFAYTIYKDLYYNSRICTPFTRKDTPVKNSKFSSILLTLILTFKEYIIKYKSCLNEEKLYDYNNILLNNKTILKEIIGISNISIDEKKDFYSLLFEGDITLDIIKNIFKKIYENSTTEIKNKILVKYLYSVNKNEINITSEQYNMSFQDIIYNNYKQWQVGYTGTASLKLNIYKPNEINVFKKIINDPDEIIEIKLALNGYSESKVYSNKVTLINKEESYQTNINIIIKLLSDDPRGFVDLAGIFLEQENKDIAKCIYSKLPHKKIVYFEDDHEAYEYTTNNDKIKYTESDKENFYYYDQCHTVGSDLKQSFNGHVAIIINRNTRYTDFAQAVFRFRKLNRGTYLSVIFIKDEIKSPITNDEIYKLLNDNEYKFNTEQQNGLKYQLLKTMIRKESKDYREIDLIPEFMRISIFTRDTIIKYINNNIKSLDNFETYFDTNPFTKEIYNKIICLPESKLIKLIVGSGNEIQKQEEKDQEKKEEKEKEQEQEQVREQINYDNLEHKLKNFKINTTYYIEHINCPYCDELNCIKLFKSLDIKINNKDIYISFNILSNFFMTWPKIVNYEIISHLQPHIFFYNRFHYIEFNNKILIEIESAALDYYINKLPVYNHEGRLLVPNMYNSLNKIHNLQILDIDTRFIKMLGIKNYINPNPNYCEPIEIDIQSVVNDLNPFGLILLSFHLLFNTYKNRYNLSIELQNRINNFEILKQPSCDFKLTLVDKVHNFIPKDNLTNVYFNIYVSNLRLDDTGYAIDPNRIYYKYVYNHQKNDIEKRKTELDKFKEYTLKIPDFYISPKSGGGSIAKGNVIDELFYRKYLKYKKKYLDLKNNL
jgi:hypothetical protein